MRELYFRRVVHETFNSGPVVVYESNSGLTLLTFVMQASRHYELLNYSEHGTTVDNVLYSCDFSEKPASTPQTTSVIANVRKLIASSGKGRGKNAAAATAAVKEEAKDAAAIAAADRDYESRIVMSGYARRVSVC